MRDELQLLLPCLVYSRQAYMNLLPDHLHEQRERPQDISISTVGTSWSQELRQERLHHDPEPSSYFSRFLFVDLSSDPSTSSPHLWQGYCALDAFCAVNSPMKPVTDARWIPHKNHLLSLCRRFVIVHRKLEQIREPSSIPGPYSPFLSPPTNTSCGLLV